VAIPQIIVHGVLSAFGCVIWCVRQAWLISSVERNWPWELLVHHVADPAAAMGNRAVEAREGEGVSRNAKA